MPSFSSAENACTTPSSRSTLTTTLLPALPATLGLASIQSFDPSKTVVVDDFFFVFCSCCCLLRCSPLELAGGLARRSMCLPFVDDFSDLSDLWCFFSFFAVTSLIFHFTLTMQRKKKTKKKKKNEKTKKKTEECLFV
jgi:hypothetical protein